MYSVHLYKKTRAQAPYITTELDELQVAISWAKDTMSDEGCVEGFIYEANGKPVVKFTQYGKVMYYIMVDYKGLVHNLINHLCEINGYYSKRSTVLEDSADGVPVLKSGEKQLPAVLDRTVIEGIQVLESVIKTYGYKRIESITFARKSGSPKYTELLLRDGNTDPMEAHIVYL